jgi:hypothetical protein
MNSPSLSCRTSNSPSKKTPTLTTARITSILSCMLVIVGSVHGQSGGPQGKGAGQGQGTPSTGGGGASLQGLAWASSTWDTELTSLPGTNLNKVVVACYTLNYGNSAAQPFLLQPATTTEREAFATACATDGKGKLTETDPGIIARCELSKKLQKKDSFDGVKWSPPCADLDANHPVQMGQTLVIGINVNNVLLSRIKILNLNVTYQQGNPINPTPVRPSFGNSGTTPTTTLGNGPYYLIWPNQVPGDTIATVNVNAIYTPPMPGEAWAPGTFYPVGSVVIPNAVNGHYYTAKIGGVSAKDQTNAPNFMSGSVAQIVDGTAIWVDSGNTAPSGTGQGGQGAGGGIGLWGSATSYNRGQVVLDPYNGHYYTNLSGVLLCPPAAAGVTQAPCARTGQAPTDPFSLPTLTDGTVTWQYKGSTVPVGQVAAARIAGHAYNHSDWVNGGNGSFYEAVQLGTGTSSSDLFVFPTSSSAYSITDGGVVWQGTTPVAAPSTWHPYSSYNLGDTVISANGQYYVATNSGKSGPIPTQPYFSLTSVNTVTPETDSPVAITDKSGKTTKMLIVWEDSGTTSPASIASGQPSDQTISLLNLQFAQSHSLSYYNLASGVVYSMVHSPTFGFSCNTASPPVCTPVRTNNPRIVDPVLLFTIYPKPWDAESHCPHQFCLTHLKTNPPGINFGFSLASPTSSFYVGASFELLRNFQVVAGYNFAKEPTLSSIQPSPATSSSTPTTVQKYYSAPFFGVTLNISGFIQSLFSAGGGGGGGGAKGAASGSSSQ